LEKSLKQKGKKVGEIAFEQLAPFLSSSPVTLLAFIVWYELRGLRVTMTQMGERLASVETMIEKS